jgi:hypothetical protein
MFVMTGSADGPRARASRRSGAQPYELSPSGDKYLVQSTVSITASAESRRLDQSAEQAERRSRCLTKFVTLAWQAYLSRHDAARAWLRSDGLAAMSKGAAAVEHK